MQVKFRNFVFHRLLFFIKSCWNRFCFLVVWLYNFITRNQWTIHNTCWIFSIFTTTCSRIPNIIFSHTWSFLHSHQQLPLFHHWFELIPPLIYICMIYALLMFSIHLFLWACRTRIDLNLLFYLQHIFY